MTRRTVLPILAAPMLPASLAPAASSPDRKLPVCAFSKHFQWTTVAEAAQLAASIGYDGLDLTVRAGGHVLPERVHDDLPAAVEAVKKAGISVPMVTAGIVDIRSPHAEAMIRTMAALGIRRYRWGGFRYDARKPIPAQIADYKSASRELAALNARHGVCAMYHTHSGTGQFGASIWDLWETLRDLDTQHVAVNLDAGHATVEGGLGGWINSTRLVMPMTRGIALKDFRWEKDAKGWKPRWCALGEGMVDFPKFLALVKQGGFEGPLQLHMEYEELGAAHAGKPTLDIPKDRFIHLCKADLEKLRVWLREAGLA
ncbi:MAG: sugar phosphate isomerase/epimerase family protein [Bryobacteraceae bacterium]